MRAVVRLLSVVLLTGAGSLVGWGPVAGPAGAAVCSSDTGVTVVVDFHELGGGVQTVCDPDGGGKTAAQLFPANGFPLDYVQRTPGFVCRVSGKPADDPCTNTPPADAYWGLFWSNGTNGQWSYSSSGAGGQRIPTGGSVAFSWQGSSNRAYPGVNPPQHSSSEPSSQPSASSTKPPSGGGGGSNGSSATAAPSAPASQASASASPTQHHDKQKSKGDKARKHHHRSSSSPTPTSVTSSAAPLAEATTPASAPPEPDDSGGLPAWVPLTAIGLLFAGAVGIGVVQRRRS